MDQAIDSLDKKAPPKTTSSTKKGVKEDFKEFERTQVRPTNLELLFSALKSVPPSSTEGEL